MSDTPAAPTGDDAAQTAAPATKSAVAEEPTPPPRELTVGARLAIVAGALLWVIAGVMFFGPTAATTPAGTKVDCGSAASPARDAVVSATCGPAAGQRRVQAIGLLVAGVVVAVGGVASLGTRPSHRS